MTQPLRENQITPLFFLARDVGNTKSCSLSVLCVYEDPLYLDRIRRNLERDSDILVEISSSVEDALHLMDYLLFDAVVTDCVSWNGEQNGFVRTMRELGIGIPVIYFIRGLMTGSQKDARRYGNVRYLLWGKHNPSPPFDELARSIHEVTAPGLVQEARDAYRWPRLTSERTI